MTRKGVNNARRYFLVAAPLLLVVGVAWAGGGGASPAQVNDPSADPLPITHLIHVVSKDTGDTAIWYAQGPDILFPHQGEFVFTHWSTVNGELLYKAKMTVGPAQFIPITDRRPHAE